MASVRDLIVSGVGAIIGLYAGGVAGGLIGAGIASVVMDGGGLETLGPVVLIMLAGAVAGAAGGAWLGLRLLGAQRPGATGLLVVPLLIVVVLIGHLMAGGGVLSVGSLAPVMLAFVAGIGARLVTLALPGTAAPA